MDKIFCMNCGGDIIKKEKSDDKFYCTLKCERCGRTYGVIPNEECVEEMLEQQQQGLEELMTGIQEFNRFKEWVFRDHMSLKAEVKKLNKKIKDLEEGKN